MASAANARSVGHRQSTQRRRDLHQRVMRTLNSKFVGRAQKGKVGEPSDFRSGGFPEAGRTVDTCADRGTAEGELGPAAPARSVHDCQTAWRHSPNHSWRRVRGVVSSMWVRPIFSRGVILSGRVSINNPPPARPHKFQRRPSTLPSRALASPR